MEALPRSPYLLLFIVLLFVAEWLWRTRISRHGYDYRALGASLFVAFGNGLISPIAAAAMAAASFAAWELAPVKFALDDWRVWLGAFVLEEFAFYWFHRWSHEIRWLWATHAVHHSPTELTLPAAFRIGWTGLISGGWLIFTLIVLAGFHPVMVTLIFALSQAYQLLLHTETVGRLGPLEWVLNTPAHHRVHHASNPRYLDKNYGGVVIVFDHLFGTFAAESPDERLRFGLVRPVTSNNPLALVFHEWLRMGAELKAARSPGDIGRILFGRPGAVAQAEPKPGPRDGDLVPLNRQRSVETV